MSMQYVYLNDSTEYQNIILRYKIYPCQNMSDPEHNKSQCMDYHNIQEKRRNPVDLITMELKYKAVSCIELECSMPDLCENTHNNYEFRFHPCIYKTQKCKNYSSCTKPNLLLCPYLHENELPRNIKALISDKGAGDATGKQETSPLNNLESSQSTNSLLSDNSKLADNTSVKTDKPSLYVQNPPIGPQVQLRSSSLEKMLEKSNSTAKSIRQQEKGWNHGPAVTRNMFMLDLLTFKSQPCQNNEPHELKHCIYYHSENDRRRPVNTYKYS